MDDSFYLIEGIDQDFYCILELLNCLKYEIADGQLFYALNSVYFLILTIFRIVIGLIRFLYFC